MPKSTRASATTATPKSASRRRSDILSLLAFAQRVARPADCVHQPRLAMLLQLLPQVSDVDRHDVVVVGLAAPHRGHQLLSRKHLPRMAQHVLEQVELGGCELQLARATPRQVSGRLQLDIGEAKAVSRTRAPQ